MARTQAPPARGQFSAVRRRGRVGPLTTVQVVAIEVVAFGVLCGVRADGGQFGPVAAGAGALGAALLLTVFLRVRGGWWYEQARGRRRWRHRNSRAAASGLPGLAPGLAFRSVTDRGTRIGIGQDADGWFAAVEVGTGSDLNGERVGVLPIERLARILSDSPVPVSAISAVSHWMLSPSVELDTRAPAVESYRELMDGAQVAADQVVWVAVRLRAEDAVAAAATRGGGLDGVERALAAVVGRVGKILRAADLPATPLDRDGLARAVAGTCGLDRPQARAQERWTAWHADGLAHSCLALHRWPPRPAELFSSLWRLSAAQFSIGVTMQTTGASVVVHGVARLAARPEALPALVRAAEAQAHRMGAQLSRLDGYHGPAVYACAPTAADT